MRIGGRCAIRRMCEWGWWADLASALGPGGSRRYDTRLSQWSRISPPRELVAHGLDQPGASFAEKGAAEAQLAAVRLGDFDRGHPLAILLPASELVAGTAVGNTLVDVDVVRWNLRFAGEAMYAGRDAGDDI